MTRENVLLLLTDQERYDVTAPDGPAVETPNFDRLAGEGVRFTRAYTPIGICSSARASLLTGQYPHTHGLLNNCHGPDAVRRNLSREHETFGEILDGAGYANSYAGKWHVGQDRTPADFGFETLVGTGPSVDDDAFERYQRERGVDPDDETLSETLFADHGGDDVLVAAKTDLPPEATRTYFLAERTIDRLERLAEGGGPFFHRTDFPGPHHPYVVPEPYASMYDPEDVDPWPNYAETFEGKPTLHRQFVAARGVDGFEWEQWAAAVAKYFGVVTFIDEQVGRVLDAMDRLGLADETVTVHTADHGDFTGSHRQFNKGPLMYDEVYRIPLVVRWPGVTEGGRECDALVSLLDLMPTFVELADETPPSDVAGRSLLPVLRGERPSEWRDVVVAEYHGDEFGLYSQRLVRGDRYKYVYNAFGRDELYDLRADPGELNNLAAHPEYAETVRDLRGGLTDWMRSTADPIADWTERRFSAVER
jgi:arylsulfatase A-like enzyme